MTNLNDLTVGDVLKLTEALKGGGSTNDFDNELLGKKVIIRTYSAGVHFGELYKKSGTEVILKKARRLYYWQAKESITLSAVAEYGINQKESRVCAPVGQQWLDAIEIIPCAETSIKSIEEAEIEQAR